MLPRAKILLVVVSPSLARGWERGVVRGTFPAPRPREIVS